LPYSQVAYGLRISANIALPGLPILPESSIAVADISIRLKDGFTVPLTSDQSPFYISHNYDESGQPVLTAVGLAGGAYGFFYSDGARFVVAPDGRQICADWPDGYSLEDACTYLLGPVLAFVLRLRGVTCLHASAVAISNHAIALLGEPHAGKSTTAAFFASCGFAVLSDDVVALVDNGSHFLVQPGYPRLNLWPDSVSVIFGSDDALPRITPTWNKRFLALGQGNFRFETRPLPLSAVYLLSPRESGASTFRISTIPVSPAMITLVTNTYVNYLLDSEMRRRDFDVLSRLVTNVPVRSVQAPNDPSRLRGLCEAIAADAKDLPATNPVAPACP